MSTIAQRVALRYITAQQQDPQAPEEDQSVPTGEDEVEPEEGEGSFGGVGPFFLPDDHMAGTRVPAGGACCANCKFSSTDEEGQAKCTEPNWVAWNGGNPNLPAPADEYCSDWWQEGEAEAEPTGETGQE